MLVNPDLTVPGHPEIFVIGDMASLKDARGRPLPGVAQVAMQQGAWAAANIVRAIEGSRRARSAIATSATWPPSAAIRRWPTFADCA